MKVSHLDTTDRIGAKIVRLAQGGDFCAIVPDFDLTGRAINIQMGLKLMPGILGNCHGTGRSGRRHIIMIGELPRAADQDSPNCSIGACSESLHISRSTSFTVYLEPQVIVKVALSSA